MSTLKPDITVAAVAARGGRFLMVEERIRGRLVLSQPAGHLEDRETLLAAVSREAREETGWAFEPQALLGIYQWRNPNSGVTTLRFAFRGEVFDHRPEQALDHPVVAIHWLTCDELRQQESRLRSPLVLRCVEDWLAGQSLPLTAVAAIDLDAAARLQAVNVGG
jgi:8-oxo-dGTP pyrophosphatase MutT (NUDIX family)